MVVCCGNSGRIFGRFGTVGSLEMGNYDSECGLLSCQPDASRPSRLSNTGGRQQHSAGIGKQPTTFGVTVNVADIWERKVWLTADHVTALTDAQPPCPRPSKQRSTERLRDKSKRRESLQASRNAPILQATADRMVVYRRSDAAM